MKKELKNKQEAYTLNAYPSNITISHHLKEELGEYHGIIIHCDGDNPVYHNGRKYTNGKELALNIDTTQELKRILNV